jgi:hypothetical protein
MTVVSVGETSKSPFVDQWVLFRTSKVGSVLKKQMTARSWHLMSTRQNEKQTTVRELHTAACRNEESKRFKKVQ